MLIGCLRSLPNAEDQQFVYYSIMMNASFSPWNLIDMLPLFVLTSTLQYAAGLEGVTALMMGVVYTRVYLILFLVLATRYILKYELNSEAEPSSRS